MAQGSEQISKRWIEGAERKCRRCGREISNLSRDVGEVRTRQGIREILCMECHMTRRKDAQPKS